MSISATGMALWSMSSKEKKGHRSDAFPPAGRSCVSRRLEETVLWPRFGFPLQGVGKSACDVGTGAVVLRVWVFLRGFLLRMPTSPRHGLSTRGVAVSIGSFRESSLVVVYSDMDDVSWPMWAFGSVCALQVAGRSLGFLVSSRRHLHSSFFYS